MERKRHALGNVRQRQILMKKLRRKGSKKSWTNSIKKNFRNKRPKGFFLVDTHFERMF